MKQLILILIFIFPCHAKVTPPPLHETSFDHSIKQDLIKRLDQAIHENDAVKDFTYFFMTNPHYIDQLTLVDLQDFITFAKYRWADSWGSSYKSAVDFILAFNKYFKRDQRYSAYEKKLHQCFQDWLDQYDLFKEAVKSKNKVLIEDGIAHGMPIDEILTVENATLIEEAGGDKDIIKNLCIYMNFISAVKKDNIECIKEVEFGYCLKNLPWYIDPVFLVVAASVPTLKSVVLEYLVASGADINEPCTGFGSTILHMAARWARPDLIKWLIEHGANINAQDTKGWTPLNYAYRQHMENNFITLLSYNPDLTIKDYEGKTLLEWAVYWHNKYNSKKDIKQDVYIAMMMHKMNLHF